MHRYHWEITDEIYTGGGTVPFKLHHRTKTNTMVHVATNYNWIYLNNKQIRWKRELIFPNNTPIDHNKNSSTVQVWTVGDIPLNKLGSIFGGAESTSYETNEKIEIDDMDNSDHAPLWKNNKCIICEYIYMSADVLADACVGKVIQ